MIGVNDNADNIPLANAASGKEKSMHSVNKYINSIKKASVEDAFLLCVGFLITRHHAHAKIAHKSRASFSHA